MEQSEKRLIIDSIQVLSGTLDVLDRLNKKDTVDKVVTKIEELVAKL